MQDGRSSSINAERSTTEIGTTVQSVKNVMVLNRESGRVSAKQEPACVEALLLKGAQSLEGVFLPRHGRQSYDSSLIEQNIRQARNIELVAPYNL
jgi:hypothetical protein